jgi:hypothetical protein
VIKAQLADVFAQRRSIEVAFDYLDVGAVAVAQSLAHDRVTRSRDRPGLSSRALGPALGRPQGRSREPFCAK